jgi:hypothetical protein
MDGDARERRRRREAQTQRAAANRRLALSIRNGRGEDSKLVPPNINYMRAARLWLPALSRPPNATAAAVAVSDGALLVLRPRYQIDGGIRGRFG